MYGKTNPRIERKILAVFWTIVAAFALITFWHFSSVRVNSVDRVKESDGSIVFVIDVANPTNNDVNATVCLTTGNAANDGAVPYGVFKHKKRCKVAAHDRASLEIRFKQKNAWLLGNYYSAMICDSDFNN